MKQQNKTQQNPTQHNQQDKYIQTQIKTTHNNISKQ